MSASPAFSSSANSIGDAVSGSENAKWSIRAAMAEFEFCLLENDGVVLGNNIGASAIANPPQFETSSKQKRCVLDARRRKARQSTKKPSCASDREAAAHKDSIASMQ